MKESNRMKKLVIGAIALIIAGAVCLGVGLAEGGDISYISINYKTAKWWPFKHAELMSFRLGDISDEVDPFDSDYQSYTKELKDVSALQVKVDLGDIQVIRGSRNLIKFYNMMEDAVDLQEENGIVNLEIDHPDMWSNHYDERIVIELTDKEFDRIEVENKAGEIEIAGIRAQKFHIEAKVGDIELQDIESKDLYVEEKTGSIHIDGKLLGNSIIMNKLGETDVNIRGKESDYHFDVSNKLGETTILGKDYDGSASVIRGNEKAPNFVKIEVKTGSVEVDVR